MCEQQESDVNGAAIETREWLESLDEVLLREGDATYFVSKK